MKRSLIIISLFWSVVLGDKLNSKDWEMKEFVPAGQIEALVDEHLSEDWLLIQLNLKNDSLLNIIADVLPGIELFSGPASYHRIVHYNHLKIIQDVLTDEFINIIEPNYEFPNTNREFWIEVKQGSETQGTFSEDDAIEYTCACLSGATDCVKLGWDDGWYNPFDYWGEAWYGYSPPYYQSIEEIRVVIRGGQCDALPTWSETYMGMMDSNGNWSQDYELSIDYTDNEYIVDNVWNGSMLMPRIGSEDNYCIDSIRLKFYYTCNEPNSPNNLEASNEEDCSKVNLSWDLPEDSINSQSLFRDEALIAQLGVEASDYEDWGAQSGIQHNYCIQFENDCGSSTRVCTQGSLKPMPASPANVNASDGEYSNIVIINWDSVDDINQYKIYRDSSWMGFVGANITEYTDYIPDMDVIYDYCIEAINECGESSWGCDLGYISEPGGDVNNDGSIDVLDVLIVINITLGNYIPNNNEFVASDINNDNMIDILDIVSMVNIILGN